METNALGQQIILQITVCFSFLNCILTFSLNKEKAFSRMFGISFFFPAVLGLFAIFTLESVVGQTLFLYMHLYFLITLCVLSFLWSRAKHGLSLLLVWLSPIVCLLVVKYLPTLPALVYLPYFLGGITILATATLLHVLIRMKVEKDTTLIFAIVSLGVSQALYFFIKADALFIMAGAIFLVYVVFFVYVFKKSRDPYIARIKRAEDKLVDMNKTIQYEVKKRLVEIERHNEHLLNMVQKDPLVDAYNKKGIMNLLSELVHDPSKDPFTIMLFDIDNFKGINDTKGHVAGDMVLKKVSNIAKANIRGFDMLGRYGGDEFLIVLPGTRIPDALFIAERFRKKVSLESEISVSVGVAAFPEDGETIKKILEAADAGLYESKRLGKNTVSHFPPT